MDKIKIYFLGNYSENEIISGPEKVGKGIFDVFSRLDYDVSFIEYFTDGRKYNIFKKIFGTECKYNNQNKKILRLGILQFAILLLKKRPRIVHVIDFGRFPLIAFLLRPVIKFKIYFTIHGIISHEMELTNRKIWNYYNLKDKLAEYIYYKKSDRLFFLSEEALKIASKYYSIRSSKVSIVPNGIDLEFHSSFSNKIYQNQSAIKLVFIGDADRIEKGLNFLIDSLNQSKLNVELFIIGSGYHSTSKNFINNFKTHLISKMPGTELAEFFNDKDIIISTSSYETFSLAVVEAMAAGLVPVVTKETGMSRYIEHGKNG